MRNWKRMKTTARRRKELDLIPLRNYLLFRSLFSPTKLFNFHSCVQNGIDAIVINVGCNHVTNRRAGVSFIFLDLVSQACRSRGTELPCPKFVGDYTSVSVTVRTLSSDNYTRKQFIQIISRNCEGIVKT